MNRLTPQQVAGIVAGSEPPGTTVPEWIAKARQESGLNADAVNGNAVGLWQVMVTAHMDKIGAVSIEDAKSQMKSPLRNWYVTRQIYAESGWKPWAASGGKPTPTAADRAAATTPDLSVSKSGGFAGDPGAAVPLSVTDIGPDSILGVLKNVAELIAKAAAWISEEGNIVRVVQVAGGVALGLVAVSIVLKPVAEEVGKVSPL